MTIPDFQTLMLPTLQLLVDGREHTNQEVMAALARQLELTEEELAERLPSDRAPLFANRFGWAKTHLKGAGLVEAPRWGAIQITDKGMALLQSNPATVGVDTLMEYPEYVEFRNRKRDAPRDADDQDGDQETNGVRQAVEKLLPDREVRTLLLRAMATGVREAHAASPGCWSLTLPKPGGVFNLNAGAIFVLRIKRGVAYVALENDFVDAQPERLGGTVRPETPKDDFRSLPEVTWVGVPLEQVQDLWQTLEQSYRAAIRIAAAKVVRSPYLRAHSDDAVSYLETEVGETLPRPEYSEPQQGAELFTTLAERFLELRAADDETGEKIRVHENDHRQRHERWSALLAAEGVPKAELLSALKDTDWYLGAKKSTAVEVTADQERADELRRLVAAMVNEPPSTPEELIQAVDTLPAGFSLGFASEVLTYVHPDAYWELNTPVWEAVKLLGFTGWDALRWGDRTDYHRYFALRPLVAGLRSALRSAGIEGASYLDVDLLLWEIAREPGNFPLPPPPLQLDEPALDDLLADLHSRHPDFTTFDAEDSSWWRDERVYKNELLELFDRELGAGSSLETSNPVNTMHRFLTVLEERLPSENRSQNLVSWRAVSLLKGVLQDAEAASRFGSALHDLLRGSGKSEEKIQRFTNATWPIMSRLPGGTQAGTRSLPTLLLMLHSPGEEMLIRTRELSEAARRLIGEKVFGDGPLTGDEYAKARRFARALFAALEQRDLRPLDLIDVQGFIHVTMARNAWIFQGKPSVFRLADYLRDGHRRVLWRLPQHADRVRAGDEAFLWISGEDRGVVAYGVLATDAISRDDVPADLLDAEAPYSGGEESPLSVKIAIIDIRRAFPARRVLAEELAKDPELSTLSIFKQAAGTVFPMTRSQAHALRRLVPEKDCVMPEKPTFEAVVQSLQDKGLHFPAELVANYLLALQTKRFVILTGISGTGKTRLAMAVAEHFPAYRRTKRPAPVDGDAVLITVQPYMLKHRRIVIPVALVQLADWELSEGSKSGGRMTVSFENGTVEQRFYRSPERETTTILLLSKELREWFTNGLEVGDELMLELVARDDTPSMLRLSRPVTQVTEEEMANREVVAVRPDWTDNRGLLGYHNPLTSQYVRTPFLGLVMRALEEATSAKAQGRDAAPFFAILDEMNLARVEHYFSDLLSCMESGEAIHLHDNDGIAAGETNDGVAIPKDLEIPPNLFIIGTVNVDETTYMFSPKVLDRAFTLELNEVDLAGFGSTTEAPETAATFALPAFSGMAGVWEKPKTEDWQALAGLQGGLFKGWLVTLNDILEREGRHFGYRVANEIARFVMLAHEQSAANDTVTRAAFDLAVLQKVLPKMHGTQQELQELLRRLFAFAVSPESQDDERRPELLDWDGTGFGPRRGSAAGNEEADADRLEPELPRTAHKLWRMAKRLQQRGFVSYIE